MCAFYLFLLNFQGLFSPDCSLCKINRDFNKHVIGDYDMAYRDNLFSVSDYSNMNIAI